MFAPQTPYAYNNLGRVYLHRLDFDRALLEFHKQLEINPQDHYSLLNVAATLAEQRKLKDAATAYTAAAQVSPNNPAVYVGLLDCYLELGGAGRCDEGA